MKTLASDPENTLQVIYTTVDPRTYNDSGTLRRIIMDYATALLLRPKRQCAATFLTALDGMVPALFEGDSMYSPPADEAAIA